MKHQILEKITKEIDKVGMVSKNIIKYGTILSLLLFIGAGIVFAVNNYYLKDSTLMFNCISIIKASVSIFAEIIIGGLIIDYFGKQYGANG
jgi:hypothetical protein